MKKINFNPSHPASVYFAIIEGLFSSFNENIKFTVDTTLTPPSNEELKEKWANSNPKFAHNYPVLLNSYLDQPTNEGEAFVQLGFLAIFISEYKSITTVPGLISKGYLYHFIPSEQKYLHFEPLRVLGQQIAGVLNYYTRFSEKDLKIDVIESLKVDVERLTNENIQLKQEIEQLMKDLGQDELPINIINPATDEVKGILNVGNQEPQDTPGVTDEQRKEIKEAVEKNDKLTEKEAKKARPKK